MRRLLSLLWTALVRLWLWARRGRPTALLLPAAPNNPEAQRRIKELRAERSAWLSHGALPCRICGNLPHGMLQPRVKIVGGVHTQYEVVEIGCLKCMYRRVHAEKRVRAVQLWNGEKWLEQDPRAKFIRGEITEAEARKRLGEG